MSCWREQHVLRMPATLGMKGRFVVKLSGIPQENRVLAEGKRKKMWYTYVIE